MSGLIGRACNYARNGGGRRSSSLILTCVAEVAADLLLDTYEGAEAAFSLRKIKADYSGYACKVRRIASDGTGGGGGDNDTCDVAFDGTNGVTLDSGVFNHSGSSAATTLGEFVAAATYTDVDTLGENFDARGRTWYSQDGVHADLVQVTTADQLYLVTAGVLHVSGGKAAWFTTTVGASWENLDLTGSSATDASMVVVYEKLDTTPAQVWEISAAGIVPFQPFSDLYIYDSFFIGDRPKSDTQVPAIQDHFLHFTYALGTGVFDVWSNGVQRLASTGHTFTTPVAASAFPFLPSVDINVQEIVIWGNDQSANRAAIQTDVNDFYGAI